MLSSHGRNLARPVIMHDIIHSLMCQVLHIVDFLGFRRKETAPTSIEDLLRPTQSQPAIWYTWFSEPHDTTSLHACPSVYDPWQSQAVTHPVMNRARRCLTSVIEPTPMSQRRISYLCLQVRKMVGFFFKSHVNIHDIKIKLFSFLLAALPWQAYNYYIKKIDDISKIIIQLW